MSSRLACRMSLPHRPRPGAEPPRRAAEQPVELALGRRCAAAASAAARGSRRRASPPRRTGRRNSRPGRRRSAPSTSRPRSRQAPSLDRAEIIVGDVEAADDHLLAVGERELLVVAQQIAPAPARHEAAEARAASISGWKKSASPRRAEAVDQQRDLDARVRPRPQARRAPAVPDASSMPDIIEDAQAVLGAVDQRDQRLEPLRPVRRAGSAGCRPPSCGRAALSGSFFSAIGSIACGPRGPQRNPPKILTFGQARP